MTRDVLIRRRSWLQRLWYAPGLFVEHFRNIRPDKPRSWRGWWIKLRGAAMLTKRFLKWKAK